MNLLVLVILSFCSTAFAAPPTSNPTYKTPRCPLNGTISCSISGRECNKFFINLNKHCTETYNTTYTFTYCNINAFPVRINATNSFIRSEFVKYTFPNLTISSSVCVSVIRRGFLNNCNRTSSASLQITARTSTGLRCFVFKQIMVTPKLFTSVPSNAPLKILHLSQRPSIRKSSRPTKRPTKLPLQLKTSTVPSTRPTTKQIHIPTGKPITKPSSRPSILSTTKQPIAKPSALPSRIPSRLPSNRPSATRTPTRKQSFIRSKKPSRRPSSQRTSKPHFPTNKPSVIKVPTKKPTKLSTNAPTTTICGMTLGARRNLLTSFVSGISPSTAQALTNSSSPHSLALSWLTNQDKRLCPGDSGMTQRFIMAAFYFSTGGDSWVGCGRNSVKTCSVNLTFVINDPLVARYGSSIWLSDVDECLWGGLACNNTDGSLDRIEFNRLLGNKLQGTLPAEIALLTNMRYLIIESCCSSSIPTYNTSGYAALQGTIPSNIGNLQKLFVLDLSYNLMSGTLPTSILNIPKLKELDLNYNNFVGTFPSPQNTTQLSKLLYVRLENNAFTGTVPNFGNARSLVNFTLQANKFSGAMPQAICNLIKPPPGAIKNLTDLWADCLGNPPKVTCAGCCTKCF